MTLKVSQDEFVGDWVVTSDISTDTGVPHIVARFDDHQEALLFAHRNEMNDTKFEKLEQLIEAVHEEHVRLSQEVSGNSEDIIDLGLDQLGMLILPHEIRWKLHILACSINDYTFWCYKLEEGQEWYRVYEVETGVYAEGVSPRHALENYFDHVFPDVLSLPRKQDDGSDTD